jgi:hypothetical protein
MIRAPLLLHPGILPGLREPDRFRKAERDRLSGSLPGTANLPIGILPGTANLLIGILCPACLRIRAPGQTSRARLVARRAAGLRMIWTDQASVWRSK